MAGVSLPFLNIQETQGGRFRSFFYSLKQNTAGVIKTSVSYERDTPAG
jgi:hypothetical protein